MKSLVFGILAGILGAAVWAGISYGTGYEVGYIAWGIGGLVGFACAKGSERGTTQMGIMAAVITVLAILAGKYMAVEFAVKNNLGSEDEAVAAAVANLENEEVLISYLADEIVKERTAAGEELAWPEGADPEGSFDAAGYPADVWADASERWSSMSSDQQARYREDLEENVREDMRAFYGSISQAGFSQSFSLVDLIFFGLAILTAFQVAAKDLDGDPETPDPAAAA